MISSRIDLESCNCRGTLGPAERSSLRQRLAAFVEQAEKSNAENTSQAQPGVDVSLNGYMQLLMPLVATLPNALTPRGGIDSNAALSSADARTVASNVLQRLAKLSADNLGPRVPEVEAIAGATGQLIDPVAVNARNAGRRKPAVPVPFDEVRD
jgi:hypothetical protein